jgi:hypothetical protein
MVLQIQAHSLKSLEAVMVLQIQAHSLKSLEAAMVLQDDQA